MANKWLGYLHKSGLIEVEEYQNEYQIDVAIKSGLIRSVSGPFEASNEKKAMEEANNRLRK